MILLLATLLAQAAPTEEPEIVVIGRRLAAVEVAIGRDPRGRFTCGLSASSGSPKLDERLCLTSATCVRKVGADAAAVKQWISDRKPALFAQFRKERARTRGR